MPLRGIPRFRESLVMIVLKLRHPRETEIRMARLAIMLWVTGLAACSRGQPVLSAGTSNLDFQEDAVTGVITGALMGEAAGLPTDTLYVTSPLIVVNGRVRSVSPLLAGVGQGGQIVISSSQLEIRPGSSWGAVDYRWESREGAAREGRATFVLAQVEPGKWRIQHVHSSSPQ